MRKVFLALMLAVVLAPVSVMADGSDPMPLCRDQKNPKCNMPPVAVVRTSTEIFAHRNTQEQCTPPGPDGCRICRTHEGPVPVCPSVKPPFTLDGVL